MKKIIISLGLVCSGIFFVSAQEAPLSPSNVILSAPVSTATSTASPIKYTIRWADNAKNESGYDIQLFDGNTRILLPYGYASAKSNATSTSIYMTPATAPVYAYVTARNEFGGNGTTSNILDAPIFSYLKSIFTLSR